MRSNKVGPTHSNFREMLSKDDGAIEIILLWKLTKFMGKVAVKSMPVFAIGSFVAIPIVTGLVEAYEQDEPRPITSTEIEAITGEPVQLSLRVDETPLIAETVEFDNITISFDRQRAIDLFQLPNAWGGPIETGTSVNTLMYQTGVDNTISYDASMVEYVYEPNVLDDDEDDELIINVPIEALSAAASLKGGARWDFDDDWMSGNENFAEALTDTFPLLKKAPLLGSAAESAAAKNREFEQTAINFAEVTAMHSAETVCSQDMLSQEVVYTALKDNIAADAIKAIYDGKTTAFDDWTIADLRGLKKTVYIGLEKEGNTFDTDQPIAPAGTHADLYKETSEQVLVTASGADAKDFNCTPSKELLAEAQQALLQQELEDQSNGGTIQR